MEGGRFEGPAQILFFFPVKLSTSGLRPTLFSMLAAIVNPHWQRNGNCRLTDSPLVSQSTLLRVRLFMSAYMVSLLVCSLLFYPFSKWYAFFSQLTNLSWMGLTLFLVSATVATWSEGRRRKQRQDEEFNHHSKQDLLYSKERKMAWSKWIIWQLYIVQATYQPIVVIVYWSFLSKKLLTSAGPYEKFISISMHGVGLLFLIIEVCLGTMQMNFSQWPVPIGLATLYVCYAQLQHIWYSHLVSSPSGYWVYPFLDTSQKYAYAWYLGLALALFIIFFIVVTIHKLRDRYIFNN